MTKLNDEQKALVQNVGAKWGRLKSNTEALKARIRARIEEETEKELAGLRREAAEAAAIALEAGATKKSIREVTSKHPGALEDLLSILAPARMDDAGSENTPTLEVVATETLPDGDTAYKLVLGADQGLYTIFTRPSDGKEFISPVDDDQPLELSRWLREHTEEALRWIRAN